MYGAPLCLKRTLHFPAFINNFILLFFTHQLHFVKYPTVVPIYIRINNINVLLMTFAQGKKAMWKVVFKKLKCVVQKSVQN